MQELIGYCLEAKVKSSTSPNNKAAPPYSSDDPPSSNSAAATFSMKGISRYSQLLLVLSPLRSIRPDILEELFFFSLIGNVQIDSVVPYILKMGGSEYQRAPAASPSAGGNYYHYNFFEQSFICESEKNLTLWDYFADHEEDDEDVDTSEDGEPPVAKKLKIEAASE